MDEEPETAWQAIGNLSVVQSAQRSISSRTDNDDERRRDFATCVTPCLSLVGGVGMNREDRREWLNAAYRVLGEVPADLLRKGADRAMVTVDHPSKIVPAIMAAISDEWAFRKRTADYPPPPPRQDMQLLEAPRRVAYDHTKLVSLASTSWGRPLVSMLLGVGNITKDQYDAAMLDARAPDESTDLEPSPKTS